MYVSFSPNQIKSATGNNGNFDNASDDIRFQASRPKPDFADYSGDFLAFAKDVAEWNLENRKRSNNFADNNSVNNNIENVRQFIIELPEHVNKPAEKVLGHPIKSHRIKADEIRHIQNRHGIDGKAGKEFQNDIPLRNEDIALLPYIMAAPDKVEKAERITANKAYVMLKN